MKRFRSQICSLMIWGPLAISLCAVFPDLAAACPGCKDAISQQDPQGMSMVQGYFWSILFMMSMPFTILIGVSTYFYVLVRRARKVAAPSSPYAEPVS